jgi:NitT/TauT family transport system permease protein
MVLAVRLTLLVGFILAWWVATAHEWVSPFFFGDPVGVLKRIINWFVTGSIWVHLYTTLVETLLAFVIGTVLGLGAGLWLALNPFLATVTDPFIKAMNSMPRLIFAPIFALWFGLGIWSKVALGVTLVFFVVFFNVFQGVREVSPAVLANTRMMGANSRQLMRHVYMPSAMSWVFSSLHNAVGIAFVGSVVGEYLGSEKGVGYLILLAEGVFDINSVIAGILVLTVFALVLDTAVSLFEDHFMRWRPTAGQTVAANA